MSTKSAVWGGILIGSVIGEFVPSLFGAGLLSYWGILGSGVGSIIGIYIGWKLTNI